MVSWRENRFGVTMNKIEIVISRADILMALAGNLDENFNYLEDKLKVTLLVKKNTVVVQGEQSKVVEKVIGFLIKCLELGETIDTQKIDYAIIHYQQGDSKDLVALYRKVVLITQAGVSITPKTFGQEQYLNLIKEKDCTFGIGPAGTGKTFLAVAMAIKALKEKKVKKIIITRPAIEAGETLGYLPGGLEMKIEPYLKPVYDSLIGILGRETFNNYKEKGWIEIAPLAYMRGRTLDHAFIILDEAQNTSPAQMKMFLTRFGYNSKVVINGDMTQMDLVDASSSGLSHAISRLKSLNEVGMIELKKEDVVRHGLVKKIINCYENYEEL